VSTKLEAPDATEFSPSSLCMSPSVSRSVPRWVVVGVVLNMDLRRVVLSSSALMVVVLPLSMLPPNMSRRDPFVIPIQ